MKKFMFSSVLVFLVLTGIYGKEILYSYLIKKDEFLESKIITENDYNSLKKQYDELNKQISLWNNLDDTFITSKVIIRDPLFFFNTMTILKGRAEGIEVGDIVINETGYIGSIKTVREHSSEIELLINNPTLSVKVQNSYGILQKEKNEFLVKNITSKEEIKEGDIIVTSDLSNLPSNIPVARVTKNTNNSIEQILTVEPLVNFENLNYVFIRKKNNYE